MEAPTLKTQLEDAKREPTWDKMGELKSRMKEEGLWALFERFLMQKWIVMSRLAQQDVDLYLDWVLDPARFTSLVSEWVALRDKDRH